MVGLPGGYLVHSGGFIVFCFFFFLLSATRLGIVCVSLLYMGLRQFLESVFFVSTCCPQQVFGFWFASIGGFSGIFHSLVFSNTLPPILGIQATVITYG